MADLEVPYYLARPVTPTHSGVVVIHEGNGMGQQLLRFCERLAQEGFAVIAPDLFFRNGGPGAQDDVRKQASAMQDDVVLTDLAASADVLRALGAQHIGVTGFCMGGRLAWHAARHGAGYDAAVGFYGGRIAADLGEVRCPTLLFFGGTDQWIPSEDIAAVAAYHPDTVVYPLAGHGFMRDLSEDFAPDAAGDAWDRTLAHFRQHLGQH